MTALNEYKCPCCDGAVSFDSTSQNMKCPYCGTEFETQTLISYQQEISADTESSMEWQSIGSDKWSDEESKEISVYSCNNCGGEIVADKTAAATSCPYCAGPVIITGNVSGTLKPDVIIPFKIDKKSAKQALVNHYKGKILLPKAFRDENRIDEIKGIYVPFWLFDADADANIRYKATRVRFWSDSRYDYTETSYFSVTRQGTLKFERVPVDGSSKIDDALMESLEPFDFSQAVDFHTGYLSGYLADKYDVDEQQSVSRANERIRKSTEDTFASTVVGYNSVIPVSTGIKLENGKAKYALFPVWLINTKYKDKTYTFAMNGQSGKFVGNLPCDKGAYLKWLGILTGAVTALSFLVSWLISLM